MSGDQNSDVALKPGLALAASHRPKLNWIGKFRVAFRGIYFGVVGQSSFVVHISVIVMVIVSALILKLDSISWCLLLLCIGMVITTELLNSAIEVLFRCLPEATQEKGWPALDIAAGAVLAASITAAIIGCLVLVPAVFRYFG